MRTPLVREGGLRSRVPLALAILAALVLGWAWAVASPVGSSPDDDYHGSSIWCPPPIESTGCQVTPDRDGDGSPDAVLVPESMRLATCYAMNAGVSGSCVLELSDTTLVEATHVDRGEYPGTYYRVMHLFVGQDVEWTVLVMRMVNVVIAVGVFLGAYLALPSRSRSLVPISLLATMVPLGLFITASINPSSWAVTGVAGYWLGLHAFLLATTRGRLLGAGAVALVSAFLASSARSDAGAYLVVVTVALLFLHSAAIRTSPRLLSVPAIGAAMGLYAFMTSGQSGALSASWGVDAAASPLAVLAVNLTELPKLIFGFTGLHWGLGWFDTAMPALTYISVLIVFGLLATVGVRELGWRKLLAVATVVGALLALPLLLLQIALRLVGDTVQARYVLPLVPVVVGLLLVARQRDRVLRLRPGQAWVVYVLLVAANAAALHTNMGRYTAGMDQIVVNLSGSPEWWWPGGPGPMMVWFLGSLAFAGLALAIPAGARRELKDDSSEAASPDMEVIS